MTVSNAIQSKKVRSIIWDPSHPIHDLFTLPSNRGYCLQPKTNRLRNTFLKPSVYHYLVYQVGHLSLHRDHKSHTFSFCTFFLCTHIKKIRRWYLCEETPSLNIRDADIDWSFFMEIWLGAGEFDLLARGLLHSIIDNTLVIY